MEARETGSLDIANLSLITKANHDDAIRYPTSGRFFEN